MERARIIRYVRLAVTALSLTACVLLVALWVRSCFWVDHVIIPISSRYIVGIGSTPGTLGVGIVNKAHAEQPGYYTQSAAEWIGDGTYSRLRGKFYFNAHNFELPYWLWVFVAVGLLLLPYVRWRFSLRTLLIATTLVAVGMGVFAVLN